METTSTAPATVTVSVPSETWRTKISMKNANVRNILAIAIVGLCFAFLFLLCKFTIPVVNHDILTVASGVILATINQVVQYFFGSSKDKSDDDKADRENAATIN